MVADERVAGLPYPDAGRIARTQVLREHRRIGAFDLDLALAPRIPDRHIFHQRPVFVEHAGEPARQDHVVVDGYAGQPGTKGRFELRRRAHPRRSG